MGLLGRQKHSAGLDDGDRYAGRPLLILLEDMVLESIGHLPSDRAGITREIVQEMWGGGDDWVETLLSELRVPLDTPEEIRRIWLKAGDKPEPPSPLEFTQRFVDVNFLPLIDKL